MWKLSQFTVARSLAELELPLHVLVFDTETSRSLTVRASDWGRIVAALDDPPQVGDIARAIDGLRRAGMVVPRDTDERERFRSAFDGARFHPPRIFPILAVTTACNIGCTYCYEAGVAAKTMNPTVIDGVLRWLTRRIRDDGVREVYPSLFGGEPLLYPRLLFALMDGLNDIAQRHGAITAFACSSNGTLMTPELASELARRGLGQIQISLDGPESVHDERRLGKRGEPSYAESLRGIKAARRHIDNVTVKVNFDRHNRGALPALFDQLVAEGLAGEVDIKLEAIALQFPDSKVVHEPALVIPPESPELAQAYLELTLEATQRGFAVRRDTAHTTPCMFSSAHGVIIGPDGNIYKCISLVGRDEFSVGNVRDDDYDRPAYDAQLETMKRIETCFEERCAYVPVCAGGCAYESIVRTGRYDLRFCTKDYLAEYHFKRSLVRHRHELEKLGARPLTAADLRAAERPPLPPSALIPVSKLTRRTPVAPRGE